MTELRLLQLTTGWSLKLEVGGANTDRHIRPTSPTTLIMYVRRLLHHKNLELNRDEQAEAPKQRCD